MSGVVNAGEIRGDFRPNAVLRSDWLLKVPVIDPHAAPPELPAIQLHAPLMRFARAPVPDPAQGLACTQSEQYICGLPSGTVGRLENVIPVHFLNLALLLY